MGEIETGVAAARLLQDETYLEAVQVARNAIHQEWEHSSSPEEREELWARLRGVEQVNVVLRAMQSNGEMAALQRDRKL
jgi:hypothetical protein